VDTLEQLRDHVTDRFAHGRTEPIEPDDDLLRLGILDSMAIMEIVGFLEMMYGVSVEGDDVTIDNFRSLAAMTELVERKLGEGRD
jgi:methoxymalonate biosynthesis acyl carrier protein